MPHDRRNWTAASLDAMATTKRYDVKDLSLAPRAAPIRGDRRMPVLTASRALRRRAAARRLSHLCVPARDHGDREPDADPRAGEPTSCWRLEPSRRRTTPPRRSSRVRHLGLRDQGRGQRHLLLHIEAAVDHKPQLTMDDGADVIASPHRPPRAAQRHHRRHGGDDDRRDRPRRWRPTELSRSP